MMVSMSKKVSLFHFSILFFIYLGFVPGAISIPGKTKDKTKAAKTKEIPLKHTRLEMPEIVNSDGKKQKEAFMALVTYPLGFINTDTQQSPFLEKYLIEYQNYKKGYEMLVGSVEELYNDIEVQWCPLLLREPVLQENGIFYHPDREYLMKTVKKVVNFDYFSKEDEEHDTIQCPVLIGDNEVVIFFSNFGGYVGDKKTVYYFALTAYKHEDYSKLSVLMRTRMHSSDEVKDTKVSNNEYMFDLSTRSQIRLNIRRETLAHDYRLFGKYAEAAFISTNYGFWNPTINQNCLYKFIETTLVLSRGYEVERRRLKSRAVLKASPQICESHIDDSRLFDTYDIKYDASYAEEMTTIKQRIGSFIREIPHQWFKFIKCPVTKGSENGFIYHHPIYFKGGSKFNRYDLFWYVAKDGDYEGKEVLLLLAPSKKKPRYEEGNQEIVGRD